MTHLLFAVVLAASYPPAPPPPPEKPLGAAPNILVASVAKDKLLVQRTVYVRTAKEVTIMVRVGDNIELRKNLVTVMVPRTEETAYELSKITAFDGAGKALDAKTLAERLKKPAPVVISADGQPVDAQYLELLKPETTVLVVAGLNPVNMGVGVPVGPNPNPNPNPNPRPVPPPPPPEKVPPPKGTPNIIGDVSAEEPKSEEPKGKEVKFEMHAGHFEKNNSGLKGDASFVVLTDAKSFGNVFGMARTMGPKPNFVADGAFDTKVVLATIQRGNKPVDYKVDKVTEDDGVLYLAYTATSGNESRAIFHSPLIVSIDKGKYKSVVFLENGKKVGTADFPKEK